MNDKLFTERNLREAKIVSISTFTEASKPKMNVRMIDGNTIQFHSFDDLENYIKPRLRKNKVKNILK